MKDLKVNTKKFFNIYLIVFGILMLIYSAVNPPVPIGEWDDYSLQVASILNDHNLGISDQDVVYFKRLYPDWAEDIDKYCLSGYTTKNGSGQMAWYFPTYSIACIPLTVLLKWLKMPTRYAFSFTNLVVLIAAIFVAFKFLQTDEKRKLILIPVLTLNPIVFYIGWPSAEVFIYSMMVIGLTFWYNKWYKRAAFFISIAGMLNVTIMSVGIIMIAEYCIRIIAGEKKEEPWNRFLKKELVEGIKYGCCYIIGVIPMLYNYYNVGHINLTASVDHFTYGSESTLSRFWAYLWDFNYGLLPYYSLLLLVAFALIPISVSKKNIRYFEWIFAFIINALLYSIMVHINSGMSGIARYNVWGTLLLIFAVVLVGIDDLGEELMRISRAMIGMGTVITTIIVFMYNPNTAAETNYLRFTPIAEWFLDKAPAMYNPLPSTFNSRTTHVDGGYSYELPVIYTAEDGYVRKILASSENKDELLDQLSSRDESSQQWFEKQVADLNGEVSYISVPRNKELCCVNEYSLGVPIVFREEDYNATEFVAGGLSNAEDWGTWNDGKQVILRMKTQSSKDTLHFYLDCSVFNNEQDVEISVNGNDCYHSESYTGDGIEFDFENPGANKIIEVVVNIPNAISPLELGAQDSRVLGLGFKQLVISE